MIEPGALLSGVRALVDGAATAAGAMPVEALAALAGALVAVALLLDWRAARRRRIDARIDAFCLRTGDAEGLAAVSARLSQGVAGALGPLLGAAGRALFSREHDRAEMRSLLRAAGVTHEHALAGFAAVKLAMMAGAAALAHFALAVFAPDLASMMRWAAVGAAAFFGSVAPEMVLRARRDARRRRLQEALPDVIDLMVIAAYGGQSIDMALDRVGRELLAFAPDIASELRVTSAEMQALPDRAVALRNFGERLDTREARAFSMTLGQSIRFGTPYSAALKTLRGDLRKARMMALEERGAKLPALLSLPLIMFILPAVFIVVLGPAILSLSDVFNGS